MGAGRPKGALNKATADVKAAAREYAPAALKRLAELAESATSEAASVAAIREILDRAYGKPTQHIGGDADSPVQHVMRVELVAGKGNGNSAS